jgi:hypothetical protein
MVISFVVAVYFELIHESLGFAPVDPSLKLVLGVAVTTVVWLAVTMLTPATDRATLQAFYDRIRPFSWGWKSAVETKATEGSFTASLLCWFLGCLVVYSVLFGTGYFLYGHLTWGVLCFVIATIGAVGIFRTLPHVGFD